MIESSGEKLSWLRRELARLEPLDPFRVLNVPPEASGAAVRAAFLRVTKRLHPNRFARESAEVRETATELFLVIRRAYAQLDDDAKRRGWRERLLPPSGARAPVSAAAAAAAAAPAAPVSARARSDVGRRTEPVRALLDAVGGRAQRYEHAKRLLVSGRPGEARRALQRLVEEDPRSRKYRLRLHCAAALEHQQAGRLDEAVRELELAQSYAPADAELAQLLRRMKIQQAALRPSSLKTRTGR